MALLDTSRTSSQSVVFAGSFSHVVNGAVAKIIAWNDARRTRAYLETLTAAELDDIGLTRADIDTIVKSIRA